MLSFGWPIPYALQLLLIIHCFCCSSPSLLVLCHACPACLPAVSVDPSGLGYLMSLPDKERAHAIRTLLKAQKKREEENKVGMGQGSSSSGIGRM